jgi:hypothetical protein
VVVLALIASGFGSAVPSRNISSAYGVVGRMSTMTPSDWQIALILLTFSSGIP